MRRRTGRSSFCEQHLQERELLRASKIPGVRVTLQPDGSKVVESKDAKKPVRSERGPNIRAVIQLETWVKKADTDAYKRFSVQLAMARTIAMELDNGDMRNANTYRALIQNIYERVDRIYGTRNLDVVARIELIIKENAVERVSKGWDA